VNEFYIRLVRFILARRIRKKAKQVKFDIFRRVCGQRIIAFGTAYARNKNLQSAIRHGVTLDQWFSTGAPRDRLGVPRKM